LIVRLVPHDGHIRGWSFLAIRWLRVICVCPIWTVVWTTSDFVSWTYFGQIINTISYLLGWHNVNVTHPLQRLHARKLLYSRVVPNLSIFFYLCFSWYSQQGPYLNFVQKRHLQEKKFGNRWSKITIYISCMLYIIL